MFVCVARFVFVREYKGIIFLSLFLKIEINDNILCLSAILIFYVSRAVLFLITLMPLKFFLIHNYMKYLISNQSY